VNKSINLEMKIRTTKKGFLKLYMNEIKNTKPQIQRKCIFTSRFY